ncbi:MAG: TVP38/TMEM64 family protein [Gammaproteobacteria bacterium]
MPANKFVSFLHRNRWRLLLAGVILGVIAVFYALGLQRYLSLDFLREQESWLMQMYEMQPVVWALAYFGAYVAITGLSLPLASAITLIAGPVFGLFWGSVIVTFAAAFGATFSFLVARFLLRDWVQARFEHQLAAINRGIEHDGIFYLFLLRLIPAFPFFVINLVMGLTPMRTRTYFWVSLVGMIPGNILYVNAGVQLGKIHSLHDLLSPGLIASFVALGVFPLLVKKTVDFWRKRHGQGEYPAGR